MKKLQRKAKAEKKLISEENLKKVSGGQNVGTGGNPPVVRR